MNQVMKKALLLLPNLLGEMKHHEPFLPSSVDKAVATLDGLISESVGGGRRFLGRFQTKKPSHEMPIALLNEHTPDEDIDFLLEPIEKGERWGLISDAGLPCIADPGSKLVNRARSLGIPVQVFVGPSSLLLSLMLSGFSGQQFTFHGYLAREKEGRVKKIKEIEKNSQESGYTHIFIETPYRNQALLEDLIHTLHDKTYLAIAWDLTLPTQGVLSQPLAFWKKSPLPNLDKKNAIFLISSP
jgi:16S rRNA (cytidine1402-2'-O)-methyltransferase